jgi:hypothetical protein
MSKNEFKSLAAMFGLSDLRYSGKRKTMFVYGEQSRVNNFFGFFRDPENIPFNVVCNDKTYALNVVK